MTIAFASSARSTVGIEWELALVDSDSGDLRQVAQTVLDAVLPPGLDQHPHIRQAVAQHRRGGLGCVHERRGGRRRPAAGDRRDPHRHRSASGRR
ncbi:hypothetical protein [Aeromicrobium sp. UC242_57]|uniref:hypothetical protein n=1 Tax=Aeromicrobium sp. UC242_57 TaxID=3374624 RepID=UPI0037A2B4B1